MKRTITVLVLMLCYAKAVLASAVVEVKFLRYKNPSSKLMTGGCCEGKILCLRKCDNFFVICARKVKGSGSCDIDLSVSDAPAENDDITFGKTIGSNVTNPLTYVLPIWEGSFSIYIEVRDEDLFSDSDLVDIYDFKLALNAQTKAQAAEPKALNLKGKVSTLDMTARVQCQEGYYPPDCSSIYCMPRSDTSGHYKCDPQTGAKVCHQHWYGSHCTVYCKENSGQYSCDASSGSKICAASWYGKGCNIRCWPKPEQFTCNQKTGKKICQPFWHGSGCDMYCKPVLGKYRCNAKTGGKICEPNWTGKDCEAPLTMPSTMPPSMLPSLGPSTWMLLISKEITITQSSLMPVVTSFAYQDSQHKSTSQNLAQLSTMVESSGSFSIQTPFSHSSTLSTVQSYSDFISTNQVVSHASICQNSALSSMDSLSLLRSTRSQIMTIATETETKTMFLEGVTSQISRTTQHTIPEVTSSAAMELQSSSFISAYRVRTAESASSLTRRFGLKSTLQSRNITMKVSSSKFLPTSTIRKRNDGETRGAMTTPDVVMSSIAGIMLAMALGVFVLFMRNRKRLRRLSPRVEHTEQRSSRNSEKELVSLDGANPGATHVSHDALVVRSDSRLVLVLPI